MDNNKPSMSDGGASIVVYGKGLENNPEHDFYKWLKDEGFEFWISSKGFYNHVCWIYVNLNSKLIARGMPGIVVTRYFGKHAVTIEEFKVIYNIFKKYEGMPPLQFD